MAQFADTPGIRASYMTAQMEVAGVGGVAGFVFEKAIRQPVFHRRGFLAGALLGALAANQFASSVSSDAYASSYLGYFSLPETQADQVLQGLGERIRRQEKIFDVMPESHWALLQYIGSQKDQPWAAYNRDLWTRPVCLSMQDAK